MLRRLAVLFLSLATFGLLAAPSAFAVRQLIVFKTNVPLEIPGRVIGPGTYTVINVNTADNSGPIEIQNAKGQALGEFLTEPVMRANPATHTVLDLQKQADAPARIKDFVPAGRCPTRPVFIIASSCVRLPAPG